MKSTTTHILLLAIATITLSACGPKGSDSSPQESVVASSVVEELAVTIEPTSPEVDEKVSIFITGGTAPYSYELLEGAGKLDSNSYISSSAETAKVKISDSTGKTLEFSILVGITASTNTGTTDNTSTTGTTGTTGTHTKLPVTNITYRALISNLTHFQPNCTAQNLMSDACLSGIHRQCQNIGVSSGFGPLEQEGEKVWFTCMKAEGTALITVPFQDLQALENGCDASNTTSAICRSAIHKLCVGKGHVSGSGIVEHSATEAVVFCLSSTAAAVKSTTFEALATQNAECKSSDSASMGCATAVKKECQKLGYASGFGVVQSSGSTAQIGCTD